MRESNQLLFKLQKIGAKSYEPLKARTLAISCSDNNTLSEHGDFTKQMAKASCLILRIYCRDLKANDQDRCKNCN